MLSFIKDLFLHFFIMMIIPLFYNLFSRQKKDLSFKIIFVTIILFTLLLTMFFPVQIGMNEKFDLKFIPIFIAFLYGGPIIGFLGIIALVVIESFTNGTSFIVMLINYLIISIPILLCKKWFTHASLPKKLILALFCYLAISITRILAMFHSNRNDLFIYLLIFTVFSFITLAFVIYLIEINERQMFYMRKLQQAEKLNSISQLAASVAHEIRNPMTTIRGFMQVLKGENNLTADQQMFVSVSLDELDRTQTIIDDFLSLARPNNLETQIINLSVLLKEISDFMHPYAIISGTEISLGVADELYIKGNPHEFKQLMLNLIKNGIEAMPTGGKLEVTTLSYANEHTVLIKDNGIGLTDSQIKRLGQPYYSTKTRGTGLGLLISYDIVRRMQGKIQIESMVRVGTTFKLTFPKENPPIGEFG